MQTDTKQNFVNNDNEIEDDEAEEDSGNEDEEEVEEDDDETEPSQNDEDYADRDDIGNQQQHTANFQGRPVSTHNQLEHSEVAPLIGTVPGVANHDSSDGVEFIEIEDNGNATPGQLKGGGGNKNKRKNKRKKKPETLLVVQPAELELHGHGGHHDEAVEWVPVSQGQSKPSKKQKRKKKKKHQFADDSVSVVVEQEPSNHLGLGLLEELVDAVDVTDLDGGHKRKHKKPIKYGRSVGGVCLRVIY